jgi:alpha-tubulin suppressor-like RCC1 family protein
VKCWGGNFSGQLGDGTTTASSTPVDVIGLGSRVVAVATGDRHTCALTSTGALLCWGSNSVGQLGDGTTTDHLAPVAVSGLTGGVVAVAAGGSHTCALTMSGGVKCWGLSLVGQLGDGTTAERHTPVDVVGLASGVRAIAAGEGHTCAVTLAGGAKCWGDNTSGQLGDGTRSNRSTPVDVSGLTSGVSAVTAGVGGNGVGGLHTAESRRPRTLSGPSTHGAPGGGVPRARKTGREVVAAVG